VKIKVGVLLLFQRMRFECSELAKQNVFESKILLANWDLYFVEMTSWTHKKNAYFENKDFNAFALKLNPIFCSKTHLIRQYLLVF
jgi:hypothetical protein